MKGSLLVLLVLTGVVVGSTVPLEALKEKVYGEIQDYLKENYGEGDGSNQCGKYPCCYVTNATDGCSLANMPAQPSTLVFPGGKSRCIFSTSSDFAFQVWPGDKDKLLLNFQGGGACWDKPSTTNPLCTTSISPMGTHGVFDRDNTDNKFSKYTIVSILYCSGDVFVGNVTRPYNDKAGVPVQQHGQANVVATYNWIRDQQNSGNLDKKFSDLVLMGQSAGSVGVQSWSGELLRFFEYKTASVIPDSYIGVFPPGTQGPFIYDFGTCGVANVPGLDIPGYILQDCENQVLTLQEITENQLQTFPNVNFGFIQSKADAVQMSYYTAIALSNGNNPVLTQGEFYRRSNVIMEGYNKYPNFIVYLVDGTQHTFTQMNVYYTASPTGPREGGEGDDMMDQWVPLNPLSPGDKISTVCEGKVQAVEGEEVGGPTLGPTYCDGNLVPKTYIQN